MTRKNLKNRQWVLSSRPQGMVSKDNFEFRESELDELKENQMLLKNLYFGFDPTQRGWLNDMKSYMPPVQIGEVMRSSTISQVIESNITDFIEGDIVQGSFGWQEFAITDGKAGFMNASKIPDNIPPTASLSVYGVTGLTAYFGLLNICKPLPGDTVVVSAASGAVGAIVGQIAKIMGCRVIGIAGSEEKTDYCSSELNFDFVINYKKENVINKILEYAPDGVDVYFDNVGGEISDAVISNIAIGGRIAICGQISLYNLEEPSMGPRMGGTLLINQASMQGFLVFQIKSQYQDGLIRLSDWVRKGSLKYKEDIIDGIENTPKAFIGMMNGNNFGKLLIRLNN